MSEKINPESWHYKIYRYNSQLVAAWLCEDDYHEYPHQYGKMIGLCPYMRMICLWGPLVALSNIIPLAALAATFWMLPSFANGIAGVLWLFGSIALIFATFIGMAYLKDKSNERKEAKKQSQLRDYDEYFAEPPVTFWTLFKDYVRAVKTKVCPILELPNDQ